MMKRFQKSLRILIASSGVLGFLSGWVLLAHAGKPAPVRTPTEISAPTPSLDLPPLVGGSSGLSDLQPLPALPPRLMVSPRFRTGGS